MLKRFITCIAGLMIFCAFHSDHLFGASDAVNPSQTSKLSETKGISDAVRGDYLVPAVELIPFGQAEYSQKNKALLITGDGSGFHWRGSGLPAGSFQLWVTYYCSDREARATLQFNGKEKTKPQLYMGLETIDKFYDSNDRPIAGLKERVSKPQPYFFREYWGTFDVGNHADLKMSYRGGRDIRVQSIEFNRVNRHQEDLSPLLNSAIGFYENATPTNALTRCVFDTSTQRESAQSSIAVCGIALAAFAISHDIDRAPKESRQRTLNLLRALNGKVAGIHLNRHKSGLFQHFVDSRTGNSASEFSTIDTAILVSGALLARNVFHDPEITAETDALWNSIDWSRCVIKAGPVAPKFYFTGADMDKFKDLSDPDKIRGIGMFNEYILLAYFCQQHENLKHPSGGRRTIMPDLSRLPMQVFRNRVMLGNHIQPSFLVQFPFFMSELCGDELYFSFVAAQGVADRAYNTEKFRDGSVWGVSAGWSPKKPYAVLNFINNPDHVVSPPIMAGFIPVMPIAADDLFRLYQNPAQRQQLPFGEILPQHVPGTILKSDRIPGVDFSVWLYGLAWNHPRLGSEWFRKNTRFTFNQ